MPQHPLARTVLLFLAALPQGVIEAQGALVDGNTYYQLQSVPTSPSSTGGLVNFGATSTSQTFQVWWYYRLEGESREHAFNSSHSQLVQSFSGRKATLDWQDVDGKGFSARNEIRIYSTGLQSGVSSHRMILTNRGRQPVRINLFAYADLDVCGLFQNVAVADPTNNRQRISDRCGDRVEFYAIAPDQYEVQVYPALRNRLLDNRLDDLSGRQLPFGPGDYSGAFQWQDRLLPPDTGITFAFSIAHNANPVCGRMAEAIGYGQGQGSWSGGPPSFSMEPAFLASASWLTVRQGLPGSLPVLLIGTGRQDIPVPGIGTLYVLPVVSLPMLPFDPMGRSSIPLMVPSRPSLCGGTTHFQAVYLDPRMGGGLAHTAGLEWVFGGL